MSGKNVSGVVPADLFDVAQSIADYEGATMSSLVSSALAFYLSLPAAARRSARYVMSSKDEAARGLLLEGCARAAAQAADIRLSGQLAANGKALGLHEPSLTDEAIETLAVAAVREARNATRLEQSTIGGRKRPARART
jgi:hypothetical protein